MTEMSMKKMDIYIGVYNYILLVKGQEYGIR